MIAQAAQQTLVPSAACFHIGYGDQRLRTHPVSLTPNCPHSAFFPGGSSIRKLARTSGPAPIRLGDAGRMKSSSPRRGHSQVGPIQKKRPQCRNGNQSDSVKSKPKDWLPVVDTFRTLAVAPPIFELRA
jgi:hypothetical protein